MRSLDDRRDGYSPIPAAANPFDQLLLDALQALARAASLLGEISTSKSKFADESMGVYSQCINVIYRGNALFAERFKGNDQ